MKNRDLILMLIDKSINAFGKIMGLSEESELNLALTIIQTTIQDSFKTNSKYISKEILEEILANENLDLDQASLLTNLLWTEAEILLKLKRTHYSLTQYENTLLLLQWKSDKSCDKDQLERKSKISQLETIIADLRLSAN